MKKKIASKYILQKAQENDFFMFLDADDILSQSFECECIKTFCNNPAIDDIAFNVGYVIDYNKKDVFYLNGVDKKFYKNCGSCFISKIDKSILQNQHNNFLINLIDHTKFPLTSVEYSRNIAFSDIPLVAYSINLKTNLSNLDNRIVDLSYKCNEADKKYFLSNFIFRTELFI